MIRFILFFLFLPLTAFADQLIIEPDMGRQPILNALLQSKQNIKLVMYGLTDQTLIDALINQNNATPVKIILEGKPFRAVKQNQKAITKLNKYHIAWHGSVYPYRFIHQKTLVIDGKKAIVMSFNFTHSAFKKQRNFALVVDDPAKVAEIISVFNADWDQRAVSTHSPDLIWSPNNSREKIIENILHAQHEIKIYAQSISDAGIIKALEQAAAKHVNIKILTSSLPKYSFMQPNIFIHKSRHYYIHAKVFIFDNQSAIVGSTNLTRTSLDDNRELSVITRDPVIIKQLNTTFENDFF